MQSNISKKGNLTKLNLKKDPLETMETMETYVYQQVICFVSSPFETDNGKFSYDFLEKI